MDRGRAAGSVISMRIWVGPPVAPTLVGGGARAARPRMLYECFGVLAFAEEKRTSSAGLPKWVMPFLIGRFANVRTSLSSDALISTSHGRVRHSYENPNPIGFLHDAQ